MNRTAAALDAGLGAFTVQDLCQPDALTEVITAKLASLTPGQFAHDRLNQGIRQILAIVRDAVCGEYPGLTLTALADFLQALDYFVRWADRIPDTWEGGFVDDLQVVLRALALHQEVVADHQAWRTRREAEGVPLRYLPTHARMFSA
jgi:uncharacterized membrane protein YkvA (DUF1232 family)